MLKSRFEGYPDVVEFAVVVGQSVEVAEQLVFPIFVVADSAVEQAEQVAELAAEPVVAVVGLLVFPISVVESAEQVVELVGVAVAPAVELAVDQLVYPIFVAESVEEVVVQVAEHFAG